MAIAPLSTIFHTQLRQHVTWKNAGVAVGSALALAGTSAATGMALQTVGVSIQVNYPAWSVVGRVATLAGDKLFWFGKGLFLSLAVPVYTAVWALPKWIITTALPEGTKLLHQYILAPVWKHVVFISQHVYRSLERYVIEPTIRNVILATKWAWRVILQPVVEKSFDLFLKLCTNVLVPLGRHIASSIRWLNREILTPLTQLAQKVLDRAATLFCHCLVWVWDTIIEPTWIALEPLAIKLLQAADRAGTWVWNTIVIPALEATIQGANSFYKLLAPMGQAIAQGASWIWSVVLIPIGNKIAAAAPILGTFATKVSQTAYTILRPAGQFISDAAVQTLHSIREAIERIRHLFL